MNKYPIFLNQKFLYFMSVVCVLTITGLACNLPVQFLSSENNSDNQQIPDQVEAAIAETLIAMAPETQEIIESHDTESNESETKEITATLTPSITPSPTVTYTPTKEVAQGYISKNTNCRIGPGDVYGLIHTFMAGEIVNLVGKDLAENYWFIQDQEQGSINCWLWGKYATPEGNTADLPVFTPPPTPIPVADYTIAYKDTTAGGKHITVTIKNTGDLTLESYSATFKDMVNTGTVDQTKNQFDSKDKIPAGKTALLSTSYSFCGDTTGHNIKVFIKICTENNLGGVCVSKTAQFKSQ